MATNVFLQPLFVRSSSEPDESVGRNDGDTLAQPIRYVDASSSPVAGVLAMSNNRLLTTMFSSVPAISRRDLSREYQGLGEALQHMSELNLEDEWKIDPPVYSAACFVAASLMVNSIPAPRLFNHGSKSVVFNWISGNGNLYLTVSSSKVSALISTPEKISGRASCALNDFVGSSVPSSWSQSLENETLILLLSTPEAKPVT